MSTPATITIEIKSCDVGKYRKCDPTKLGLRTTKEVENTARMLYPNDVKSRAEYVADILKYDKLPTLDKMLKECKRVRLPKYITFYHHWDGYPDRLGEILKDEYSDYDTLLNLALGGNYSTIIEGLMPYIGLGNHWKDQKADCSDEIPERQGCYQYLYKNGIWYYRQIGSNNFKRF